jgi:hypothetical protein
LGDKITAMKKSLFLLLVLVCTVSVYTAAQQSPAPDSLKEYTGKYVFPEGSAVEEVNVTLDNGALFASSVSGSSELRKLEKDVFEVVSYAGRAIFRRNGDAKITGVRIEIDTLILEGTREEKTSPAGKLHNENAPADKRLRDKR